MLSCVEASMMELDISSVDDEISLVSVSESASL